MTNDDDIGGLGTMSKWYKVLQWTIYEYCSRCWRLWSRFSSNLYSENATFVLFLHLSIFHFPNMYIPICLMCSPKTCDPETRQALQCILITVWQNGNVLEWYDTPAPFLIVKRNHWLKLAKFIGKHPNQITLWNCFLHIWHGSFTGGRQTNHGQNYYISQVYILICKTKR